MIASFDKFTWGVIGVVRLLLVIAVATVNLTAGTGWEDERYVEDGSPERQSSTRFWRSSREIYSRRETSTAA